MPRSQRPRKKPRVIRREKQPINPITVFVASDTDPMPTNLLRQVSLAPLHALTQVTGSEPNNLHAWMLLCDAINVMHTLVEIDAATDPSGLIADAKEGIQRAIERKTTTDSKHPVFDGPGLKSVRLAIDSYSEILAGVTHQMYLFALNETEARMRAETRNPRPNTTVIQIADIDAAGAQA